MTTKSLYDVLFTPYNLHCSKSPSEINIATPVSFWLLTTRCIFCHPFPLYLIIYLKLVFHTQHVVGSYTPTHTHTSIYFIHWQLLFFNWDFILFTFKVTIDRSISTMFLTVFYLLHLFSLFTYFSASSDFNWYFIWFYLISSLNISIILLLRNV